MREQIQWNIFTRRNCRWMHGLEPVEKYDDCRMASWQLALRSVWGRGEEDKAFQDPHGGGGVLSGGPQKSHEGNSPTRSDRSGLKDET